MRTLLHYARIASRHLDDPGWWTNVGLPLLRNKGISAVWRPFLQDPVDVMDERWDTLVILDACRFDSFESVYRTYFPSNDLVARISPSSTTPEFIERSLSDEAFHDTVYVTANPIYRHDQRYETDHRCDFHDVIDVWLDDWDDQLESVHPASVTSRAKEAHERYPHKRLIVHYMQPHFPFIGSFGRTLDQGGFGVGRRVALGEHVEREQDTIWRQLEKGEVSEDDCRRAYVENLELALEHVAELVEFLDGETVITSDHGNFMGEFAWPYPRRFYGHPKRLHHPILAKVPWLRVGGDDERSIEGGSPRERDGVESEVVEDRLAQLGYRSE